MGQVSIQQHTLPNNHLWHSYWLSQLVLYASSQPRAVWALKMINRERQPVNGQSCQSSTGLWQTHIKISHNGSYNNIITLKSKASQVVRPLLPNALGRYIYHLAFFRRLTFPAGSISLFPIKTHRGGCPPFPDNCRSYFTSSILLWFSLISMKGHFHSLTWRMPLKYEPGVCRGMWRLDWKAF